MKSGIYVFWHKREKLAYVGLSRCDAFKRSDGHFKQISGLNKPKIKAGGRPTASKRAMLDAVPERTLDAAKATFEYRVVEILPPCDTLLNEAEKRWEERLLAEGWSLYNTAPCGQSPICCACCKSSKISVTQY
jgi:hypothetical protein